MLLSLSWKGLFIFVRKEVGRALHAIMPKIEQKQVVINEIKEKLQKASSIVLINSRGLTVEQDTNLRKKLREGGVDYKVYKNTMISFAVEGTEYEQIRSHLAGPSAVAFSYGDATLAARIINSEKKSTPLLEFKAGIIENKLYDSEGISKIANIAPREELLSRLLGSFKSPMASFARVVKEISKSKAENQE